MDRTTLMNKYLRCAKLLKSDTLPDDLSNVLEEVVSHKKLFTGKLNAKQRKPKLKRSSNVGVQNGKCDAINKSGKITPPESSVAYNSSDVVKLTPRIYITRLVTLNMKANLEALAEANSSRPNESDDVNQETPKRTPQTPKKKHVKPQAPHRIIVRRTPANRIIESDESSSTEVTLKTRKRAKSQIPENETSKPPAHVRRTVRQIRTPKIKPDEVNLETKKRAKSEIPQSKASKPSAHVRRIVRRTRAPTNEPDESSSSEGNLETKKRAKSEIPEKETSKPLAHVRRIVRRTRAPTNEPDESSSSEGNLETKKRAKSEIPEKETSKPLAHVRRIVRRIRSPTNEPDESSSSEGNLETKKRAKSEIPNEGGIFWRGNRAHPPRATESVESDSYEVNIYNRELSDGCTIS